MTVMARGFLLLCVSSVHPFSFRMQIGVSKVTSRVSAAVFVQVAARLAVVSRGQEVDGGGADGLLDAFPHMQRPQRCRARVLGDVCAITGSHNNRGFRGCRQRYRNRQFSFREREAFNLSYLLCPLHSCISPCYHSVLYIFTPKWSSKSCYFLCVARRQCVCVSKCVFLCPLNPRVFVSI